MFQLLFISGEPFKASAVSITNSDTEILTANLLQKLIFRSVFYEQCIIFWGSNRIMKSNGHCCPRPICQHSGISRSGRKINQNPEFPITVIHIKMCQDMHKSEA